MLTTFDSEKIMDMKELPKLFHNVNPDVYSDVVKRLQELRRTYPEYRDDQLLVFLTCEGYTNMYGKSKDKQE